MRQVGRPSRNVSPGLRISLPHRLFELARRACSRQEDADRGIGPGMVPPLVRPGACAVAGRTRSATDPTRSRPELAEPCGRLPAGEKVEHGLNNESVR